MSIIITIIKLMLEFNKFWKGLTFQLFPVQTDSSGTICLMDLVDSALDINILVLQRWRGPVYITYVNML